MSNTVKEKLSLPWILGWAVYLACSWTWCIGMFLPVLLVRDYGIYAWLVFALPNVIGAAAMPYILKKVSKSKELVDKHKTACTIFSIVSILFQVFFIGWISMFIPKALLTCALALLCLIYLLFSSSNSKQICSALFVWIISIAAFLWIAQLVPASETGLCSARNLAYFPRDLLYLAPVCIFGFLLCPYLDLTFHKALQCSKNSKRAFTIGFGVMFLLMILFTLLYALPMINLMSGLPFVLQSGTALPKIYLHIIAFHIILQAGFTVIVHLRSIESKSNVRMSLFGLGVLLFCIPLILKMGITFLGISANEVVYRSFMGFYGLIAPAYVFLCMLSKHKVSSLVIAVFLALPFFALGFLGINWSLAIWLIPGLAVIFLSRYMYKRS